MENKSNWNCDDELTFVTDQQGNSYLVSRRILKQGAIPPEKKTVLEEVLDSDVKGYEDTYMVEVVKKYFGTRAGYDEKTESYVWDNEDLEKADVNDDGAIGIVDLLYWMKVK